MCKKNRKIKQAIKKVEKTIEPASPKQKKLEKLNIIKKNTENNVLIYKNMKDKPILFVRDLTKKYFGKKRPAIENLNFDVYPGEFHAFIGANGAGKTTTIKSLIGAYQKWTGTVLIKGIKNNKEEAKRKLGYIPENARFPEKFSSLQYLQWMVMLSGFSRKKAREFAIEKLKEMKMWSLRNKSPNSFSSGQKKKVLLAQALIHNPDIIIMDEPVANLDPKARIDFFNILQDLRKKGKAIFISSHVLAELDRYSDSITVLDGGKVIYSGSKKELLDKYYKNIYLCSTTDDKKFRTVLKENKIISKRTHDKKISVVFKDDDQIKKIQTQLIKHKIFFNLFEKILPTLDEIYKNLVVLGSVDTMKE